MALITLLIEGTTLKKTQWQKQEAITMLISYCMEHGEACVFTGQQVQVTIPMDSWAILNGHRMPLASAMENLQKM